MPAQEPPHHDGSAWPAWEVQGHGSVTATGDSGGGPDTTGTTDRPARHQLRSPWVDVRLTFEDGARLDVLAVVRDGRVAIEDAQADPPLPVTGLAALAEAIEAPLRSACQVVAGEHRPPVPQPATEPEPEADREAAPEADREADREADPEPRPAAAPGPGTPSAAGAPPDDAGAGDSATAAATPGPAPSVSGRHRARTAAPPRGGAARRGIAAIYRAAQGAGQDPVLAVMSVTGFSRRKALRLIAGARDDGHLSPRHHRR